MKQRSFWGKKKTHPPHLPGKAPVLGCAESSGVLQVLGSSVPHPLPPPAASAQPSPDSSSQVALRRPCLYFSSLPGPTSPEPGFTSSQQPRPFRLTSPAICGPSCLLLLTETQTDVSLLQLQGQALPCLGTSCPVLCTLPILLADAKAPNKSGCPSGGQLRAQATVGGPEHGLGQRRRAGKGSDTTTGT